jgi:hypothetical protein
MLKLAIGHCKKHAQTSRRILLCTHTPALILCIHVICTHTLQPHSAVKLCTHTLHSSILHSHSAFTLCTHILRTALRLGSHTQHSYSALKLCTHTQHSYSALILCTHDPVFIHFALQDSALIDSVFISLRLQIPRLTCHLQFPDSVPAAVVALC